ncbi:MAG: type II secretion system minor pseudopilin GspI [Gammaproteobacteria bacterium]
MSNNRAHSGFTLIEVMIAIAIVGLGLMAIITQISQTLSESYYLRDKTVASWIALDRLTEIRLQDELPKIDNSKDELDMAGIAWAYNVKVSATDRDDLRRIDIDVSFADRPDTVLASITGFMAEPAPADAPVPGSPGAENGAEQQAGGRNGPPPGVTEGERR